MKILSVLLIVFMQAASGLSAEPLRIMAVGDSITAGFTTKNWAVPFGFGYRAALAARLAEAGYRFQFVGQSGQPWNYSSSSFPKPPAVLAPGVLDLRPAGQDFHRGHGGASIGHVSKNIVRWLNEDNPDVVLLMIGANNMGHPGQQAENELNDLAQKIVETKPIDKSLFSNGINHPNGRGCQRMAQTWFRGIQGAAEKWFRRETPEPPPAAPGPHGLP